MSTTNPTGGIPDPVPALAPRGHGTPTPSEPTHVPVDPTTIARGHEEDRYDWRAVWSVPALVVAFFVLAFSTVTVLYGFIANPSPDPNLDSPQAVERNRESLNDRLARIGRGKEVNQPRLEDLKMIEGNNGDRGNPRAFTQPVKPTGNSPWVHPEDLRPNPENTPALYQAAWANPGKTVARIPIDDAMKLATDPKAKLLPTQAAQSKPVVTWERPTAANAGRGFADSRVELPSIPEPPKEDKKK